MLQCLRMALLIGWDNVATTSNRNWPFGRCLSGKHRTAGDELVRKRAAAVKHQVTEGQVAGTFFNTEHTTCHRRVVDDRDSALEGLWHCLVRDRNTERVVSIELDVSTLEIAKV